jgi:GAF domain-containing protein
MNAASGYQDILHTLAERTLLGKANPLLLMAVFDQPLSGEMRPEWIFPVAYRASGGLSVAERYPLSAFEAKPGTLFTDRPVILDDLASDARLDRVTRTLFQEVFQACSSVVFPLMLGKQMIGFIQAFYDTPTDFPAEEETRLTAVTGQAAIAVQSRLLLEQAQSRALREQRIRQVTTEVMNATNVNTILRRAVEQVGQALGLPAYIYLGTKETGEKSE